jgi:hypothetical protein
MAGGRPPAILFAKKGKSVRINSVMDILIVILCFVLIIVGLIGIIIPFLPGIAFVWLGIFIYASKTGFETISLATLIVFSVITVLFFLLDFLAPLLGAKKYKSGKWGVVGAFLGTLLGVATLGPIGLILGPFLGALAGELISGKERSQAFSSAFGAVIGFLFGTLLKLIFGLVMFGFFVASFFR